MPVMGMQMPTAPPLDYQKAGYPETGNQIQETQVDL